jgi:phosphoglycolate phosphatase
MVGDTVVDILAGKKAGTQTVGVLCGFGEKRELERAGADLILPSTTDLADYLLDQKQAI